MAHRFYLVEKRLSSVIVKGVPSCCEKREEAGSGSTHSFYRWANWDLKHGVIFPKSLVFRQSGGSDCPLLTVGLVFLSAHFLLIVDMICTTLKRWDSISGYVLSTSSSSSQVLVIPGKHQMFCSADSEWGIICDFWVAHLGPYSTQICGTCMSPWSKGPWALL